MSNEVFEFKKFSIRQNKCAMKVGTDGVLLGAWVGVGDCKRVLDIGTGTGMIALMLAQKTPAYITALEINQSSFEQATENVRQSTYKNQINVVNTAFQEYWKASKEKFDLIVSNPPYFVDSLKSNDTTRSTARHADALPFNELIEGVNEILSEGGKFCVILPKKEAEFFCKLAEQKNLYLSKLLRVRNSPDKEEDKRHIMQFEFGKHHFTETSLYIRTGQPLEYSPEYKQLTTDYYIHF
ncbi:MAG: methyltransferase [Bacteroidota bacterium]|nr:methyltransferase [Bacteroidota bacterium]